MRDWTVAEEAVEGGCRYVPAEDGAPLTRGDILQRLAGDGGFADWYSNLLADSPFEAFYWENPPLTAANRERPAEFVLMDAPELAAMAPRPDPFAAHFGSSPENGVVTFHNLGGDALLVVPEPLAGHDAYPHLAAFLRRGPRPQIRALWRTTVRAVLERSGETPLWLSTSGTGVAWLHVRLDRRPKYYQYAPYRSAP